MVRQAFRGRFSIETFGIPQSSIQYNVEKSCEYVRAAIEEFLRDRIREFRNVKAIFSVSVIYEQPVSGTESPTPVVHNNFAFLIFRNGADIDNLVEEQFADLKRRIMDFEGQGLVDYCSK